MTGYIRTPNTNCILCEKPLHRKPYEFKKARYFACMNCRADALRLFGITEKQKESLKLGWCKKGTNNRGCGWKQSEEFKRNNSQKMKEWYHNNPEKAAKSALKRTGELNYRWKGGVTKLQNSIRSSSKNRKWMKEVKQRDNHQCQKCGSSENLESDHIVPLSILIEEFGVKSYLDAKNIHQFWDISNGVTLCLDCHFLKHGRKRKGGNRRRNLAENARTSSTNVL